MVNKSNQAYRAYLIGFALILLLAAIIAKLQSNAATSQKAGATPTPTKNASNPSSTRSPFVSNRFDISMYDNGLSMPAITIKINQEICFVNDSSTKHQPVSDPHPAHSDLADFGAKAPLAIGEQYCYTFTKAGTYNYHDELKTSIKGSIVVTE